MKVEVKKESGVISAIIHFKGYDSNKDKEEIEKIKSEIAKVTEPYTRIIEIVIRKNGKMIVHL